MFKVYVIVCALVIGGLLVGLALAFGKADKKPVQVYGEDIDYQLWRLTDQIEKLTHSIPEDIEANKKKISELTVELEKVKILKSKLNL